MMHSFTAEDPAFQISVDAGTPLQVEVDHGDGWIEVSTTKGQRGCVPKAYTLVFDGNIDSVDTDTEGRWFSFLLVFFGFLLVFFWFSFGFLPVFFRFS